MARFIAASPAPAQHALKLSGPRASGISPAASGASTISSAREGGACGRRSNMAPAPRMLALWCIRVHGKRRPLSPFCQAVFRSVLSLWPRLKQPKCSGSAPNVLPRSVRGYDQGSSNSDTERTLCAIVVKRKISGPTRSRRGGLIIARGFSVIETCWRQGRDAFEYLQQAVIAWLHGAPAPSE